MFVKICGITRVEDAIAAVEAGANALGFVFWPKSPRFVDPYRARTIVMSLPPFITPVGLFVNQPADYVNGVATLVRLGAVQLHGDETPEDADAITRPVIRAITTADAAIAWPARVTLLVDAQDPERRGGTGKTVDWNAAAAVAKTRRTILAGGLTPENVADAIARVQPFGVDVSSGVEQAPGIKDRARLRAFLESVHGISNVSATRS
ncbi:MAG TPA: phosphoribosylanthranilate isomerase [Vicinamibacterales bacterium]|nr:phosphoribosylanthranilate isomerase [Vicinamibacterales bacterium]